MAFGMIGMGNQLELVFVTEQLSGRFLVFKGFERSHEGKLKLACCVGRSCCKKMVLNYAIRFGAKRVVPVFSAVNSGRPSGNLHREGVISGTGWFHKLHPIAVAHRGPHLQVEIWLVVVWNIFYFPIYWE